jgi:hypothetical protein
VCKVRPHERPAPQDTCHVHLAGGEYETVLFGVANAGSEEVQITEVHVTLAGNQELKIRLYRQEYVEISKPSSLFACASVKGLWPDPLVPLTLEPQLLNDERDISLARSVVVPPGGNRAFVLELYLPLGASRSPAHGQITCEVTGCRLPPVEILVLPYNFDLPSTSSIQTAAGFESERVAQKHAQLSSVPFDPRDLHLSYLKLLAAFRLSPYVPQYEPLAAKGTPEGVIIDWTAFDRYVGAYLDGTLWEDILPGTTMLFPPAQAGLSNEDMADYYRAVAEHLRSKGWLEKAFYYLPDEPLTKQYPEVRRVAEEIKSFVPDLRTLVTEPFTRKLEEYTDIWCPDFTSLGDSITFLPIAGQRDRLYWDCQLFPDPSVYRKRRDLGESAWFYTCISASFGPYPNLFIDSAAAAHRVIPWLAFRYGLEGFLYWDSVSGYAADRNPWENSLTGFVNGDGNLLYPGTPEMTGLSEHIGVPSLRMLLLREGFEDFEFLTMLASREVSADTHARKIAYSSIWWEHRMNRLQERRDLLGSMIEQLGDEK